MDFFFSFFSFSFQLHARMQGRNGGKDYFILGNLSTMQHNSYCVNHLIVFDRSQNLFSPAQRGGVHVSSSCVNC